MNKLKYIFMACLCCLMAGCMDNDWDEPSNTESPFGNNSIQETNVISIADLKTKYASTLSNQTDTACITEDLQLKVRVTGNDIGGNIYNEIAVQDENGDAVLICIAQGGLFGYLPVGQQILVDLKGLYIGNYGYQIQIGTPYTNSSGYTFPSRMSRILWQQHFKIVGAADTTKIITTEFDVNQKSNSSYLAENCGKLMIVKNVQISGAGTQCWAPEDEGNNVNRRLIINGKSDSYFVVRSSCYADFANDTIPTGTHDITGIFTRYGTTWQILLRTLDDVK